MKALSPLERSVNTVNNPQENAVPERIQLSRKKGYRKPEGAIVVSRPSRWGNPFRIGDLVVDPGWWQRPACPYDGGMAPGTYKAHNFRADPYEFEIRTVRDAADAVALFRDYVDFYDDEWPPEVIRRELAGRDLACWCPLPEPGEPDICHAVVLMDLAADPTSAKEAAL